MATAARPGAVAPCGGAGSSVGGARGSAPVVAVDRSSAGTGRLASPALLSHRLRSSLEASGRAPGGVWWSATGWGAGADLSFRTLRSAGRGGRVAFGASEPQFSSVGRRSDDSARSSVGRAFGVGSGVKVLRLEALPGGAGIARSAGKAGDAVRPALRPLPSWAWTWGEGGENSVVVRPPGSGGSLPVPPLPSAPATGDVVPLALPCAVPGAGARAGAASGLPPVPSRSLFAVSSSPWAGSSAGGGMGAVGPGRLAAPPSAPPSLPSTLPSSALPSFSRFLSIRCMRHGRRVRTLNRPADQRRAMLRALTTQVLANGRATTTRVRAKEVRRRVDRIVTLAKRGDQHALRLAMRYVYDKAVLRELFRWAPHRYRKREGGYSRLVRVPETRRGDNAQLATIELCD